MSRPSAKSHASSKAALSTTFGGSSTINGFGNGSSLSYLSAQPDLSTISDANLVVSFKKLAKKDSTTKSKALEEIENWLASVKALDDLEDAFLAAWSQVFPRLSIDNARRVRQLSFKIQGVVSTASGKRIVKYLPDVIGSWLAGLHDPDKVVARAAHEALNKTFPTEEKRIGLRKQFQSSILSFSQGALLEETVETLSDERNTTKEDSEAKYARVLVGATATVTDLLVTLDTAVVETSVAEYKAILSKVASLVADADPAVRRAGFSLIRVCLDLHISLINPEAAAIGKVLVSKSTSRSQLGSAVAYTDTLLAWFDAFPDTWTSNPKYMPLDIVQNITKHGSQGGSARFWQNVTNLVAKIPSSHLPADTEQARTALDALQTATNRKDEQRLNAESASACYYNVANLLAQNLPNGERDGLLSNVLGAAVKQYLEPTSDDRAALGQGQKTASVLVKAISDSASPDFLSTLWLQCADRLLELISTSAPEQSKNFETSQQLVSSYAARFFNMQRQLLSFQSLSAFHATAVSETRRVIEAAIDALAKRNGKPTGAAATLLSAQADQELLKNEASLHEPMERFASESIPLLVASPSVVSLMDLLFGLQWSNKFAHGASAILDSVLSIAEQQKRDAALDALFRHSGKESLFAFATESSRLQEEILSNVTLLLRGEPAGTTALALGPQSSGMSKPTLHQILGEISKQTSQEVEDSQEAAVSVFDYLLSAHANPVEEYLATPDGAKLVQSLLRIAQSRSSQDSDLPESIATLNANIDRLVLSSPENASISQSSTWAIIERELYDASYQSLNVGTLVDLALKVLNSSDKSESPVSILPKVDAWSNILNAFEAIPPALSTTDRSPLGGAIFLLQQSDKGSGQRSARPPTDAEGLTVPFRLALFTASVLQASPTLQAAAPKGLYQLLATTTQLVREDLSVEGSNGLVQGLARISGDRVQQLADTVRQVLPLQSVTSDCWEATQGLDIHSYRNALIFATSIAETESLQTITKGRNLDDELQAIRQSNNELQLLAFIAAYQDMLQDSAYVLRLVNEAVAELTGSELDSDADKILWQLILANVSFKTSPELVSRVAKQRLVFLTKKAVQWLGPTTLSTPIKIESLKMLAYVLPCLNDVYGEFWGQTLSSVSSTLHPLQKLNLLEGVGPQISLYHCSLALLIVLRQLLRDEDTNDDLKDSLTESTTKTSSALLALLKAVGALPDANNEPLRLLNEQLARQIKSKAFRPAKIDDTEELYALVAADSAAIQQVAFDLLHRQIPQDQQEISVNAALDRSTARLPEELLSLVLETPVASDYEDEDFAVQMPAEIKSYLSSWLLIFDHFKNASDKVKLDYAAHIKEGGYLDDLLRFVFDFLGHSQGKPVDGSKISVATYSFEIAESALKDTQWLSTHLYYLCLRRLPSLTKSWWLDLRSKQTRMHVEAWTTKHVSPAVIGEILNDVDSWSAAQSSDPTAEEELSVKTNRRSNEIVASREIDEQSLAVVIAFPANFPLAPATVVGRNRVAVDEKKWQSWILNCQGVIQFSNNSVTDGLLALRRNISGALKGQSECAICYSLVSADKQLPTKKCATCKNAFHGSCLYRWFKSSNSSSCPLCRNPFNYS